MADLSTIQQAANDLALIRRAIERAHVPEQTASSRRTVFDANLLLQIIAFSAALVLTIFELATGHVISHTLKISATDPSLSLFGIGNIGLALLLLVMCAYFIIWRAARHADQPFHAYLANNFTYLRRLSFVGDLVVKFVVVSLLILSGKPEWIAPILVLFIGDYLIQGRFFILSLRIALAMGLSCFATAALLFFSDVHQILWPLLVFLVVDAISMAGTLRARLSLAVGSTNEG